MTLLLHVVLEVHTAVRSRRGHSFGKMESSLYVGRTGEHGVEKSEARRWGAVMKFGDVNLRSWFACNTSGASSSCWKRTHMRSEELERSTAEDRPPISHTSASAAFGGDAASTLEKEASRRRAAREEEGARGVVESRLG